MNMFAFSTLACPAWSIQTTLRNAVQFGYEGIEWRGGPEGHIPPGMPAREIRTLRQMSADAGLSALAVTTYTSFVSASEEERRANVDELRRYADLAAELDAEYVRAFLGELPAGAVLDQQLYETISDCLSSAADHAASVGVKIAVEPHDDFTRSADVAPVLNHERSHADVRVIWDIGNTFAVGEEPDEGFRVLKDRLAYVQVKDGNRKGAAWQLCAVGEGGVPLRHAFELLAEDNYAGAISVEWEYAWHPELDPPEIALPAAARTVRKLWSTVRSKVA